MSKVSRWVDRHVTHRSERKKYESELRDQMDRAKQQQEEALQARRKLEAERDAEKKRTQEKEVRAKRSRYRVGGFLQDAGDSDTSDTVG